MEDTLSPYPASTRADEPVEPATGGVECCLCEQQDVALFLYIYNIEMYSSNMVTEMPVTEARERFSEVVDTSAREPVFLTKRGQRQAVVISTAEYERLLEADEDAEDLAASDAVMNEIMAGNPTIPWAKVKADLGLS